MNESTSPSWKRGFWSLMVTQFQNAFSDNALKNLIILAALAHLSEKDRESHVAMVGALFAGPFILFSMLGGWMADRFSKQRVMQTVKTAEIGIMIFAAIALGLHNQHMQLFAIFMMGCHSAFFGPSKYGILPEILPLERLSWGNGLLELLTFLGIILGTVTGGLLAGSFQGKPAISGVLLAALALLGWFFSRQITHVPAGNPTARLRANPITDLWREMKVIKLDRDLWRSTWGNAGFFAIAALVQMNLLIYAKNVLQLNETQNGLLSAALAIGIGVGSVIAGYASRGHIEYRLVPLGALGLALSTIPMGLHGISTATFTLCLIALGLSGGLFIVPITAVLQHRPAPENKGGVQGAASLLSWIGILGASAAQVFLNNVLHFSAGQVFWACGAMALGIGAYVAITRPESRPIAAK